MGIKGLSKLISDNAPGAIATPNLKDDFGGRVVAIDASVQIYQFMMVVGRVGDQLLSTEAGNVTSHIQGMLYSTTRLMEAGIKPIFVFDGKAPGMKAGELAKRAEKREQAEAELAKALGELDEGDANFEEKVNDVQAKFSKRQVKVTREQAQECRELLELMGVPYIEAPSEAEAQCAQMIIDGLAYAMASEDMDSITFGAKRMLRHFMKEQPKTKGPAQSAAGKENQGGSNQGGPRRGPGQQPLTEYKYDKVLQEMGLTREQFVDLCILCGCDYCGTIKGIGQKTALQLIKKHGSIEAVLQQLDKRYIVPDDFNYAEARAMFLNPEVLGKDEVQGSLVWKPPNEEALLKFLTDRNFNEDRVKKVIDRLKASKKQGIQRKLDSFFTVAAPAKPTAGVAGKPTISSSAKANAGTNAPLGVKGGTKKKIWRPAGGRK